MASKPFLGLFGNVEERADLHYRRGNLTKAAELFLKAGRHGQAAALYVENGDVDRAVEVYAQAGQPLKAAELLDARGRQREAVPLYEEAGALRQAAEACLALHQYVRAGRLYEESGLFHAAAESFARAGELELALASWARESEQLKQARDESGDEVAAARIRELDQHRAEVLTQVGRYEEAAELLLALDRPRRAGPLFERAGALAPAARAYLAAAMFDSALALLERDRASSGTAGPGSTAGEVAGRAIDDELRLEILLHNGEDAEAGALLESMGRFEEAAAAYEDAMEWGKAARLWERAELVERAAELYFRVERYEEAGQCYAQANEHEKAGKAFALAGNDRAAADAYLAAEALLKAGEHYLKGRDHAAAQDALQSIEAADTDYPRASLLLIPLLLEQGLAQGARHRLEALEASPSADRVAPAARFYWRGRIEEALGDLGAAEVSYQKVLSERSSFRDTGKRLAQVRHRAAASAAADGPGTGDGSGSAHGGSSSARDPAATAAVPVVPEAPPKSSATATTSTARSTATPPVSPSASPPGSPADAAPEAPESPESPDAGDGAGAEVPAVLAGALAGLPFEIEARVEPWWPGTSLLRVRSFRSKKPGLLLIFPLDVLGPRADSFRHEAARIQALEQPAVLALEEIILTERHAVLHYQAFPGTVLSRHLRGPWRPLPTSALNLLVQVCDALAAAHHLGVAHQWLSPNTLLIDEHEHVRMVGFGLRDLLPRGDSTANAYLAPELHEGLQAGPAADIYSLGLLGVELLGALLPAGWSAAEAVDPATVRWPEGLEDVVPEAIRASLLRCLARNPLERPSAEGLKTTLSVLGLVPGQVLQARYEILGELGRGGMSRVYRAYDKMMDEEVAIKTLLSPMLRHSPEEKRLLREVRICRKISHPNVVRVHDMGNFPGGIFITMELLDGVGLDELIRNEAPLPLARVSELARQIAQALSEAHRMKVVHRDLKPSNVILIGERVKVLDFGIARMGEAGGIDMTRTGEVVGSPLYMAPEQIQGKPLDGTCDLYALGVITYTLLAGREPFVGDTPTAVVYQHLRDDPPDIREFRGDLPERWSALLARLLAKKPQDRYPDADALIEALRALPAA